MGFRRLIGTLSGFILLALLPQLTAKELNLWPAFVKQWDSPQARLDHAGSLGPIFSVTDQGDTRILSIRPLWTSFTNAQTGNSSRHILYPLLNWFDKGDVQYGHAFNILQYRHNAPREDTFFQFVPFIFSRKTPDPEESYFALWPVGGVLKNRLSRDRITFAAWPLFVRTQRDDETRTHVPYPFLQFLNGPRSRGFGLWPLYGHFQRDNDYDHTWALWPFYYDYKDKLDEAVPYARFGVLPFYSRETAEGLKSETFVWPFFGYTLENEPRTMYSENRYFWPLFVQGRGEERYVNRWMPFYTDERKPGYQKHWYLWPLLETERFEQPGLTRERTSFLYFLYRDERQYFADTSARLTFLWPFFGYWNDGYDRRQLQVLDPLSVFFPSNRKVKENWTPLFALYRFDERSGNARHSVLWDMVVWEKDPEGLKAIYAGPLFEWVEGSHWELLKGLVGSRRENGETRTTTFWRD
ncbi:hypothetical protein G0Q06_00100 [Puniceicoccales bacterium CK1056]|uniref:Uncharacterized protein n=1 Tax=Oceanipulchritudo coccoides TaxID=2706888 RepID=A0A6B2LXU4_9BACT|nr:hypothetical protein [Oceanipulchritudo coccoides]NDV60846.1 hypothetical protein [Oceanipulchritudo coccoides]